MYYFAEHIGENGVSCVTAVVASRLQHTILATVAGSPGATFIKLLVYDKLDK